MPLPIGTNQRDGQWHAHFFCSKCKQEMTDHQRSYSFGVCPMCGHADDSTICDTYTVSMRWVPAEREWWQVWKVLDGKYVIGCCGKPENEHMWTTKFDGEIEDACDHEVVCDMDVYYTHKESPHAVG